MLDQYNREINYLRISITDRCNLRCRYCIPSKDFKLLKQEEILSYEEILSIVREAINFGIEKIRITGGEPLVREGIVWFVSELSKIKEIKDLSMTTNGILLERYAKQLKEAGLKRINISLDTLDPEKFKKLTIYGSLDDVLKGIEAADKAGLHPIKLNCVIKETKEEPDAQEVLEFARKKGYKVRFIHEMNLAHGNFSIVEGGEGGDCSKCNRIRLTANGKLKPCLFNNVEFDVRKLGIKEALRKAIYFKPFCGSFNTVNMFNNIGG